MSSPPFGAWPPNSVSSFAIGDVLETVPNGAAVVVLPAPPAGFVREILDGYIKNLDGAATISFVVTDDNDIVARNGGVAIAASAVGQLFGGAPYLARGAIAIQITGAGTSAKISFSYRMLPSNRFIPFRLVLTNVFQAVPSIIPPAGKRSRIAYLQGSGLITAARWYDNADIAHTIETEITRGAKVLTLISQATSVASHAVMNFQNLFPIINIGVLEPGDVIKFRTQAAVVTPGNMLFGGAVEIGDPGA